MKTPPQAPVKPPAKRLRPALRLVLLLTLLEVAVIVLLVNTTPPAADAPASGILHPAAKGPKAGDVVSRDAAQVFTGPEASALIRHNYPTGVPGEGIGIRKVTFKYRSQLPSGKFVNVYGRAYFPDDDRQNLPVFAFAPGTTGIGDQCAASLEKPATANWGNYDAHMSAYAAQGYAAVTTDYEGMRDPDRLHHYMVGELEGRALLDAVRGLRQLREAGGRLSTDVFLSGYSQGGHAAFWGDKIAAKYAPDVVPLGVVGFGPVLSVKQTLTDITHAANINWFGPNVLVSYRDYYQQTYPGVILPNREPTLTQSVLAHCIDTDLPYWGHTPVGIYTPEFIQAAQIGTLDAQYPQLAADLDANAVGAVPTSSAKRINEGALDNVVLPAQQAAAVPALCASSKGPVQYVQYPKTTHYDAMLHSFSDTLTWMKNLTAREAVISTCI